MGLPPPDPRKIKRARTLSLLLFLVVSGVLWLVWAQQRAQWAASVRSQVDLVGDQAAMRLGDYVRARLLATRGLMASERAMRDDDEFTAQALTVQREFGGFQAINRMTASGVIELVTPVAENRDALGRDVSRREHARAAFEGARETGEPHLTDALELFQGGHGFAVYFPIREGPHAGGFINGVFRVTPIVETALRGRVLSGYWIELDDDAGQRLLGPDDPSAAATQATEHRPASTTDLTVLNRHWTLRVWPRDELWRDLEATRPDEVFLFALLLVALVSWLIYVQLMRELQRDRVAEERREMARRLETTTKMEALGRLAGGVAHDFNNILTVIMGSARIVQKSAGEDPRVASGVAGILDAAARASELTRQLLSFARQSPTPVERVDLDAALRELEPMLGRLTPGEVTLVVEHSDEPLFIDAARSQLSQVFVNLVVNAVDAMPSGGTLAIRARAEDEHAVLEVQDTGVGMDAATRNHIFEPFFTTKAEGEGTGLGLATVYGIVASYHGKIDVDSEPGQGATFRIRLPLSPG
ncbi:MAG: CHASE domain-containing protein [Myxococcales bacterium]|nr:CHASE domain-containing protein [Myxococcales bacterium]MCB9627543.1 CHASE domain-containing protein [Sandaracinaceae bacterium]